MDTLVTETNGRLFLTNSARVVRSGTEVSQDLASASNFDIERSNPYLKWIVGDFVEADNPNGNTQFWTKDDLALGEYSIKYSPLNMLHKQQTPIGFFASTRTIDLTGKDKANLDVALKHPKKGLHRFIHPRNIVHSTLLGYGGSLCVACGSPAGDADHDGDVDATGVADTDAAAKKTATTGSAKIEALAGMWSHVFPFESAMVDQADEMGSLFYSMECRGTHLHCAGPNGCDQSFDYMAPETHCAHLQERTSIRHIVNPTFRGGALILPPTRPGWANANASVVQDAVREEARLYAEQTEGAFNQLTSEGTPLTVSQWEHLMATVVSLGHR